MNRVVLVRVVVWNRIKATTNRWISCCKRTIYSSSKKCWKCRLDALWIL